MKKKKVWTAKDVIELQILAQDTLSLNMLVGDEERNETMELGEIVVDKRPGPEEIMIEKTTSELLLKLIKALPPKEQKVILMRYNFETGERMTLDAIGKKYGVTRERIRQIEDKALNKIRKKLERMNLKREDL